MAKLDLTRRRFLQALGAGGAASLVPWEALALARPLPAGQPIVVSIFLGGGLDGAHLLVPTASTDYGYYADQRGGLAVPLANVLPLGAEAGLNRVMPLLHARAGNGEVAFVRGVDLLGSGGFDPLSHFDKTDYVMMGRSHPSSGQAGIWARWADGQAENPLLLATVGFGLPRLFSGGAKPQGTSLPASLEYALGAGSDPSELALVAALRDVAGGYAPGATSLEARLAQTSAFAIEVAGDLVTAYPPAQAGESDLTRNLRVIAALIDANITGTRVYATLQGGYDTHENELYDLEQKLLPDLDASLEAFFAALQNRSDVLVMIWTEFGRRARANTTGTDHGTANNVVLIGERVRGGLYGAQPSFAPARLDANGNLVGAVPFEAIYAELIDELLGGGSPEVLGGSFAPVGFLH